MELPQHEETTPLNSRVPYAVVKNVGESFFRSFKKSYDLDFTSGEEKDTVFENDGYKIFMDAKSMIYLKGMALDFQDGLQGKGFQFINPNATSTCGCGESFSMS